MNDLDPDPGTTGPARAVKPRTLRRRVLKGCAWSCGGTVFLCALLVGLLFVVVNPVPKAYPAPANPADPPTPTDYAGFGLDGFESPYLGHTGSWDGKGGGLWGGSKLPDLEKEVGMGLRWTFMPVHWSAMEPDGPVDLTREVPSAWQALDAFVIAAQKRRLNVLMQAPARIKAMDPKALIVAPGLAAGKHGLPWLEAALDAAAGGLAELPIQGRSYSIGPVVDAVSLHNYEGIDSAFSREPRTVGQVFQDVRAVFEKWEQGAPGFTYPRKQAGLALAVPHETGGRRSESAAGTRRGVPACRR